MKRTSFEFGGHDTLGAESDVVSGAHGGIGGCDDGHSMGPIGRVEL